MSASQCISNSTKAVSSPRPPRNSQASTAPPVGQDDPSACRTDCRGGGAGRRPESGPPGPRALLRKQCYVRFQSGVSKDCQNLEWLWVLMPAATYGCSSCSFSPLAAPCSNLNHGHFRRYSFADKCWRCLFYLYPNNGPNSSIQVILCHCLQLEVNLSKSDLELLQAHHSSDVLRALSDMSRLVPDLRQLSMKIEGFESLSIPIGPPTLIN